MSVTDRLAELESRTPRFQAMGWGIKAPERGGSLPSGVTAGWFVVPHPSSVGTLAMTLNVMYAHPIDLVEALKIDQLKAEVTTAGASANVLRLGIYYDDGSGNKPGGLLVDAGTQSATTTGVKTFASVNTLPAGRLWLVGASQVGTACTVRSITVLSTPIAVPTEPGTAGIAGASTGATVTGALPATAPALTTANSNSIRIYFRAA